MNAAGALCLRCHQVLSSLHCAPAGLQVVFKNLRIMNGNSKEGFGGAVEVSGPVDLQFIDCEFGGSISAFSFLPCMVLKCPGLLFPGWHVALGLAQSSAVSTAAKPLVFPLCAGGDGGAVGIVSNGVVRFTNCAFYDNYCQWGSGGAGAHVCICGSTYVAAPGSQAVPDRAGVEGSALAQPLQPSC